MTALTQALPLRRIKARHRIRKLSIPTSVQKLAEIPLTTLGIGSIVAGIALVCVPAALIIGGFALVGLEYLIADQ